MCDEEWLQFCTSEEYVESEGTSRNNSSNHPPPCPKSSELYISTKSKIGYLTREIDLSAAFWNVPIIPYHKQCEGVIKKQIKITLNDESEINSKLEKYEIYNVEDISKRKNKIVKKISIGITSKDLISYRCKKKGAFYNCFVLIFRINYHGRFKEMHVKIFNTGKLEIPGVPKDDLLNILLEKLLNVLNSSPLNLNIQLKPNSFETVLINSNFNCGYNIHREKLVDILKYKYKLCVSYDPCSYPGIMSKFYYHPDKSEQNGMITHVENTGVDADPDADPDTNNVSTSKPLCISFMIFRTGSVLIVGKCDNEGIINEIYHFIKNILQREYLDIYANSKEGENNDVKKPNKKKKVKKRKIIVY